MLFYVSGYDPIINGEFEHCRIPIEEVQRLKTLMDKVGESLFVCLTDSDSEEEEIDRYEADCYFWEFFGLENPVSFDDFWDELTECMRLVSVEDSQ